VQRQEKTYENIKANNKVIKMYPFNSTTKKMTVIVETEYEKSVRVYTKGASENIIEDCNSIIDQNNGEAKTLDQSGK
jgi:magnesium-transporting ATPase (P-type)